VKLSKSTLVVPLAGLLLIGAAGAVAAASSGSAAGTGDGIVAAAPSATPSASTGTTGLGGRHDALLGDVLDDLVADGTITGAQKTAITDALAAERTARVEDAKVRMEQLRTFLEDDVITQEEFDQLPEDSRLRDLASIMDDGQITRDELGGLRGAFGGAFGGRGGHGGRGGFFGGFGGSGSDDATPTPSASPTTGS
jgi:hypothetical protein